jgi:hypothetical protein
MGVDLRMEPYATMFEKERPESRIIPELCLPDVDKLFESLGLSLDEFHALADKEGRLPHEAALRLFKKGQEPLSFINAQLLKAFPWRLSLCQH